MSEGCSLSEVELVSKAHPFHITLLKRILQSLLWFQTYSGLFCVTVNPYKWLPVYNQEVVVAYSYTVCSSRDCDGPFHLDRE